MPHFQKLTRAEIPLSTSEFWLKTEQGPGTCQTWIGQLSSAGYPIAHIAKGVNRNAARVVYALEYGEVPEGHAIIQTCRNRTCVNPIHLRAVKQGQQPSRRNRKLTPDQVAEIRASQESTNSLAKKYGLHLSNLSKIRKGHTYAQIIANPIPHAGQTSESAGKQSPA